jgi:hypothetical protein
LSLSISPGNLLTLAKWDLEWLSYDGWGFCRVMKRGRPNLLHSPTEKKIFPNNIPGKLYKPGDLIGLLIENSDDKLVIQFIPGKEKVSFKKNEALEGVFAPV